MQRSRYVQQVWKDVIIVLLISWILSGSTGAQERNRHSPPDHDTRVPQLRWYHQFQFAGYYAAAEKGFYQEAAPDNFLYEPNPAPSYGRIWWMLGSMLIVIVLGSIVVVVLMIFNRRLQQEIEERKQTEQALQESQENFRRINDNIPVAVYSALPDEHSTNTFVSGRIQELTGHTGRQFLEDPNLWESIVHPDDRANVWKCIEEHRREKIPLNIEYRIITNENVVKWIKDKAVLVLNDQQQIIRTDGFMEDITDRKRAEEAIQTLNNELEQRVKQRTAELEATNSELQEFAYVVSHDLKAPLRGISHVANWLVEDYGNVIDRKGREMAELLINRVKRMDNLIEGILHYSRIGRIEEEHETIDLNILLREVLDLLNPPDHIRITIDPNFPTIFAERTRIFQVFQNLIGNAIKFMDKVYGKIRIHCEDEDSHWIFSVTDNGPGIEKHQYERIFQIFQTLHPRDELESTGIGLALVKKIVELYGGKIWVESTIGQGSTFCFTLPKGVGHVL